MDSDKESISKYYASPFIDNHRLGGQFLAEWRATTSKKVTRTHRVAHFA